MAYALVDAAELIDHPQNFRVHPRAQEVALTGSLNDLGWISPVIVNRRTGRMVDGHLRAKLAAENGSQLPVAYVELSEEEEKEALLALDPIAAMAEVDKDRLRASLAEVASEEQGIKELLERLARENDIYRPTVDDPGADLDHADELQEKWQVELGPDLRGGRHRIMCGDATDPEAVQMLLPEGPAQHRLDRPALERELREELPPLLAEALHRERQPGRAISPHSPLSSAPRSPLAFYPVPPSIWP